MKPIIQVENLGKCYRIGAHRSPQENLRERLTQGIRSTAKRFLTPWQAGSTRNEGEAFWALNDVSFDIHQGDHVGIIGRNGAGKTTLLKILSRITDPTKGRVTIRGRVASLLEVGTGFHPELTGRENIFLNGAILGMSKQEIYRKFDEIVAFAEVEKFLDTPVKHYSSGMYVRLAFSVAAHLEPEILVVDEVLAVGDAAFQKKCFGKMATLGQEGKTVLFVSHSMAMITKLCRQAIYLDHGQVAKIGPVEPTVSAYLESESKQRSSEKLFPKKENATLYFSKALLVNHEGMASSEMDVRFPFSLKVDYEVVSPVRGVELSVRIETQEGHFLFTTHETDGHPEAADLRTPGHYQATLQFPAMFLVPGHYLITLMAHEPMIQFHDLHEQTMSFTVVETGTRLAKYQHFRNLGSVMLNVPWVTR